MYVEASVQVAPWWGLPLVAAGFLVLGAVIGFVGSTVQNQRQMTQQDRRRWDDLILKSSTRMVEIAWRLQYIRNPQREGFISDPARRARVRTELTAEFQEHYAEMRLIGSSTLRKAAGALMTSNSAPEPEWDKVDDAIQEFTDVVRRELRASD